MTIAAAIMMAAVIGGLIGFYIGFQVCWRYKEKIEDDFKNNKN